MQQIHDRESSYPWTQENGVTIAVAPFSVPEKREGELLFKGILPIVYKSVTRPISRVLSWTAIYLGRTLPSGSRHLLGTRRATLCVPPRCCSG